MYTLCVYIYIYMYVYVCMYVCVYIYIYKYTQCMRTPNMYRHHRQRPPGSNFMAGASGALDCTILYYTILYYTII